MTQPYSAANGPYTPDPSINAPSLRIPIAKRGRAIFNLGNNITPAHLALATLTPGIPMQSMETQQSLFFPGACPLLYDGARVHEAGFNFFPEVAYLSQTTGGQLTASVSAVYSFLFVYEWTDLKGVLHRSAPSVPISKTMTAANTLVSFRVAPLHLTHKQGLDIAGGIGAVQIVCYRTTNGGTLYYRDVAVGAATGQGTNKFADLAWAGQFNSSAYSDANIISNELFYTTGGALENGTFPSATVCASHQGRIFSATSDNQNFVQYTEVADDPFFAVATSEVYRLPVPREGGSVVGLASLDDKLIIFCQRRIYFVTGEGPNRLGQQNGYSLPQLCSAKLGAMGGMHDSIALTPDGLWFMSSAGGLRLLTRGLQIAMEPGAPDGSTAYLGREADGFFVGVTAVRAVAIDAKAQVRFYTVGAGSYVVVYDYQQQQWSRFTNHDSAGGAVSARGLAWHSNGTSLYSSMESAGGQDDVSTKTQVLESAWIALADVQGFQRVYKLMLLAQAMGPALVEVAVGYNYDETWITGGTTAEFFYCVGAAANPLQLEHLMHIQQCEAIRFRLTITPMRDLGTCTLIKAFAWKTGNGGTLFALDRIQGSFATGSVAANTASAAATGNMALYSSGFTGTLTNNDALIDIDNSWTGAVNGSGSDLVFVSTLPVSGTLVYGVTSGAIGYVGAITTYLSGYGMLLQNQNSNSFINGEQILSNDGTAEAIRLTNFGLTVGLKKGTFKLPNSKRF